MDGALDEAWVQQAPGGFAMRSACGFTGQEAGVRVLW